MDNEIDGWLEMAYEDRYVSDTDIDDDLYWTDEDEE